MIFSLLIIAASFFATLFSWVGSMRMSVYGRLGAGFQFGNVWAMVRHDFSGLLRILGMAIVLAVVTASSCPSSYSSSCSSGCSSASR